MYTVTNLLTGDSCLCPGVTPHDAAMSYATAVTHVSRAAIYVRPVGTAADALQAIEEAHGLSAVLVTGKDIGPSFFVVRAPVSRCSQMSGTEPCGDDLHTYLALLKASGFIPYIERVGTGNGYVLRSGDAAMCILIQGEFLHVDAVHGDGPVGSCKVRVQDMESLRTLLSYYGLLHGN